MKEEINWRNRSESSYESIWSIVMKYGYLNRVRKSVAKADILGEEYSNRTIPSMFPRYGYTLPKASRRLLVGNPLSAWMDPYILNRNVLLQGEWVQIKYLRYCPECMARGYHSPIHQLPWVVRCPIHLSLLQEVCPRCRQHVLLDNWIDLFNKSKSADIGCHCSEELWPNHMLLDWPKGLRKADTRPIGAYLRWIKAIHLSPYAACADHGNITPEAHYDPLDLQNEFIGYWRCLIQPPPTVERMLSPIRAPRVEVLELKLKPQEAESLSTIIKNFSYRSLIEDFVLNQRQNNRRLSYQYAAKRLLDELFYPYRNCAYWRKKLYLGWGGMFRNRGDFDGVFSHYCPRGRLAELIANPWISLWSGREDPRRFVEQFESSKNVFNNHVGLDLAWVGLATIKRYPVIGNYEEELTITWHCELNRFCSRLLAMCWSAAVSGLCRQYLSVFSENGRKGQTFRGSHIPLKMPYVISYRFGQAGYRFFIFNRNVESNKKQFSAIVGDRNEIDFDTCFCGLFEKYKEKSMNAKIYTIGGVP